ncbi:MAG TPA: TraX family protein [Oscillospiraceae bacterium]|nr:TraX family protein [Oscillospiraceae bacterium]
MGHGLSGRTLKIIAVSAMVADHFGSTVLRAFYRPLLENGMLLVTADTPRAVRLALFWEPVCGDVGRVAFPIFCFLLVEGFVHTKNAKKYALRLFAFALLSEIPYNLAFHGAIFYPGIQNVLFTLTIGLLTLMALRYLEERGEKLNTRGVALRILVTAAGGALAYLIRSEYVFLGVAAIAILYLLRGRRFWRLLACAAVLVIVSPWTLPAYVLLWFYDGRRGGGSKYFFYIFYPAHLLVLWAAAQYIVSLP